MVQVSIARGTVNPVADDAEGKKRSGYYWTARRHKDGLLADDEVGREAARNLGRTIAAGASAAYQFATDRPGVACAFLGGMLATSVLDVVLAQYTAGQFNRRMANARQRHDIKPENGGQQ